MRYFEDYTVNGDPILVPDADADISENDVDDEGSGRDETGYMHRIVLREKVKKWVFKYSRLTREEYGYMKSLFKDKPTFTFGYVDEDGQTQTTTAYCSSNSAVLHNAREGIYKNFSISIIEC